MGLRAKVRDGFRQFSGATGLAADALMLPVGQIGLDEARFLSELVAGLRGDGPIIEIGTLFGFSTRVMAIAKHPSRELITVDNYSWNPLALPPEVHRRCTKANLAEAVRDHRVKVVRADKADFYASYTGPAPSLAFLDAIHSYEETRKDIEWARAVHAGIICVHDYGPHLPEVVQAVDEAGGPAQLVRTLAVLP